MQRVTLVCLCLVALPAFILAYPWDEDKMDTIDGEEGLSDEDRELDLFNNMKRNSWCARWGDFCRPDAKMKYAQCCPGLRCMCGSFWTQGKCQCKSKGTFGR